MTSGTETRTRDEELAAQLPDDWSPSNEIPSLDEEQAEDEQDDEKKDGEGDAEPSTADRIKNKLDPEDIIVVRDKDGNVQPIEVPLVMHPQREGTITIRPLTARDEKRLNLIQVEHTEKIDNGEYEQKGDYDLDADGNLVGYDGIALEQIRLLINEYILDPDFHFETNYDMTGKLRERDMNSLFYTAKIYGTGMSLTDNDDEIEQLTDKKK